jgi:hypothetical protein
MSELITDAPETQVTDNAQPTETQTQTDTWVNSLSEEYRNHPSIQKFTDPNGLAKSYLSLESMMGQEKIPVPKGADDTNAWGMYRKAFNVPENADGYNIKIEGVEDDKLGSLKELFHKHNISQEAAQELTNAHLDGVKDLFAHQDQLRQVAMENATAELKKDWGLKYEENLKTARNFLEKMAGNEEDYKYFEGVIGNDAKFIKLLTKMGESISEGSLGGFEAQSSGFVKTPAEAKAEFDAIMNNPDDAYWAGSRNKRDNIKYCKEHNLSYVPEEERKARVQYVNSLMAMMG